MQQDAGQGGNSAGEWGSAIGPRPRQGARTPGWSGRVAAGASGAGPSSAAAQGAVDRALAVIRGARGLVSWSALALALGIAGNAGATGIPVVDALHIAQTTYGHYTKYMQDAMQYAKEVNQWKQTYDHYRQQLVQGPSYRGMAGDWAQLQKRDPDAGMAESCPVPKGIGGIAWQQHAVCQQTVRAQNAQYNEIVKILDTARKRDAELQSIYNDRASVGTDQGRLDANNNQLAAFQARVQMDLEYSAQVVSAYDSYLATLQADQVRLANEALKGRSGLVGDVVRGAALTAALRAARHRDR